MQCRNPINRVCTFYTYHMCGAYMSEGKKKLPILTYTWSVFENVNLSGMVFTLESSDMSFLSAPGINHIHGVASTMPKSRRFVKTKTKKKNKKRKKL